MSRQAKKDSNNLPPFVPATEWTQMLEQFRSKRGPQGIERRAESKGERKPALSLLTTNPEHATTFNACRIDSDFRVIVQNLATAPVESIPLLSDDVFVSIAADITDSCFADLQFVRESTGSGNIVAGPSVMSNQSKAAMDTNIQSIGAQQTSESIGDTHDLELDLLENVQEISRYLCRTTARRAANSPAPTPTPAQESE